MNGLKDCVGAPSELNHKSVHSTLYIARFYKVLFLFTLWAEIPNDLHALSVVVQVPVDSQDTLLYMQL